MSATAIAQVTAALKGLLKAGLPSTATVTLLQPSEVLPQNALNLYLFRVAEVAQLKNVNWRGNRTHRGTNQPALALELFYLLTPFADPPGSDQHLLPQAHMLLGQAMQVLHENPVVNDVHMAGFDFDAFPFIDDLRASFDNVIVRLHPISVDEISKIWSMFDQPYRLSVVYEVSLVQIEPARPVRTGLAPVMATGLDVFVLDPPRLSALDPPSGGAGTVLSLHGFGLARRTFRSTAQFGGQRVEATFVSETRLEITIPSDLEAGPQQQVRAGLDGQVSNPLNYVVSPWLRRLVPLRGAPTAASPVDVHLEVEGVDLLSTGSGPVGVRVDGTAMTHTVVDSTHLTISIPATLDNGDHAVQITVGGQSSNVRNFEVVPAIATLTPASPTVGSALQINGARLAGAPVRVHFGTATVDFTSNANASQLQVPRVPRLEHGEYELRVSVAGHQSNALRFSIA